MNGLLKSLMIALLFVANISFVSCDSDDRGTSAKAEEEISFSSQNHRSSSTVESSSSVTAVAVSSSSVQSDKSSSSICEVGRVQYLMLAGVKVYYICEGNAWVLMPVSSSSSAANSSSSVIVSFGEFQDIRDKQSYKTVVIDSQTWMAQNLNYGDSEATTSLKGGSWCYENSTDSCAKYGRLYTWAAAMRIDSAYQHLNAGFIIKSPHHGICPIGWHLPDSTEWAKLMLLVSENNGGEGVSTSLKSTMGWNADSDAAIGTDLFGFSALPAGYRNNEAKFYDAGFSTYFWMPMEEDGYGTLSRARAESIYNTSYRITMFSSDKTKAYSVRCIKD